MTGGRALAFALAAFGSVSIAVAGTAAAFSDPVSFSRPAIEGGGGGREFTGSPQDGLGCGVCHGGAVAPSLAIEWRDLPGIEAPRSAVPDTFQPGRAISVALRWNSTEASHALQLELVDGQGAAPVLAVPPEAELPASARCDGRPDGPPAVYAHDIGARHVVGVEDCGAGELTFTFTAPAGADLYFALGMVRSNSDGDPRGDGVLELRRRLRAAGTTGAGCTVAGRSPVRWAWLPVLLLALAVHTRRRRPAGQSKRSERNSVVSTAETSRRPTNAR
ncbi:MAG: MYXO-CTERM sorting domain-containing protein [Bacteroidota bacterium]